MPMTAEEKEQYLIQKELDKKRFMAETIASRLGQGIMDHVLKQREANLWVADSISEIAIRITDKIWEKYQ